MHKLLFDNNISHRVLPRINKLFLHSTHVMLENLDQASDFNDLVIFKGTPPKVIWLKIGNCRVSDIEKILKTNEQTIKVFLNEEDSAIMEI